MKINAVVLGEYGMPTTSCFCVYQLGKKEPDESSLFLCLQDVDALIVPLTKEKGHAALHHVHRTLPDHLCRNDVNGHVLMSFTAMAHVAHQLNQHALAEFCKLTWSEILGGAASPLLLIYPTIQPVTPYVTARTVVATSVGGFDDWFTTLCQSNSQREPTQPGKDKRLSQYMQQLAQRPLWQGKAAAPRRVDKALWQKVSRWFDHGQGITPAAMMATLQTRRQQHAIIASRHRRACLSASAAASTQLRTKAVKKRKSNTSVSYGQLPIPQPTQTPSPPCAQSPDIDNTSLPLRPSAPAFRSLNDLCQPTTKPSPTSPSHSEGARRALPPPWPLSPPYPTRTHTDRMPPKWASWSSLPLGTGGDSVDVCSTHHNLDLLATQAIQRQPILTPSIQLPSPSEMLSLRPPPGLV